MNLKNRMRLMFSSLPKHTREYVKKLLPFLLSFGLTLFKAASILIPCYTNTNVNVDTAL